MQSEMPLPSGGLNPKSCMSVRAPDALGPGWDGPQQRHRGW
jgi:hypothetical protein